MRDSEIASAKQRAAIVGGSVGVMLGGVVLGIVAWMNSGSPTSDEPGADSGSYYGATDAGSVRRKLKQIAIGMLNFHDIHRSFVPAENRQDKRNLSWRVHLLPHLDQKPLYDKFNLDEPWDSEHNLKLLTEMPDIYKSGDENDALTRFQVLVGPHTLFATQRDGRVRDCTDGARHTILVVQSGLDKAIPWTKPHDLPYDPENPIGCIGDVEGKRIETVTVDGKPLSVRTNIAAETFASLATASGNEVLDAETVRRDHDPPATFSMLIGK
jgi:hypothetical protein